MMVEWFGVVFFVFKDCYVEFCIDVEMDLMIVVNIEIEKEVMKEFFEGFVGFMIGFGFVVVVG